MIIDLPKTTSSVVGKKLVELRSDSGAMALSRVLTLIIVTDEDTVEEAIASANLASHQHPCRILALVKATTRGSARMDAQIRVGGDAGASEVIVMRLYGELTKHGAAVVLPLLLPDSPIVGWWPTDAPARTTDDPIGALCQRRITDSARAAQPFKELQRRGAGYAEGDTDLAWSRITRWRAVLASALDQPPYDSITGAVVTGGIDSPSTDLLAAWLAEALDVPVVRARTPIGSGLISVRLERTSGPLDLVRPDGVIATLTHPLLPVRRVTMQRRSDAECLADELGRLDNDEVFEKALVDGLPRLTNRRATASELVRKGLAPSPDESRKLARKMAAGRNRTAAEMVELVDGDVVAADTSAAAQAPEPVVERAVASKAVAAAAGFAEGSPRRPTAKKAETKVSTATSRAAVKRAADAAAQRSEGSEGSSKSSKKAAKKSAKKAAKKSGK